MLVPIVTMTYYYGLGLAREEAQYGYETMMTLSLKVYNNDKSRHQNLISSSISSILISYRMIINRAHRHLSGLLDAHIFHIFLLTI